MAFKQNGYSRFFNHNSEKMGDHHGCRLGKWYVADGKAIFGNTSAYPKILSPHEAVHRNINEGIANGQNLDVATANFKKAEEASKELFAILNDMLKQRQDG
ncbi:CZB domain-containing protein [Campylobacter gastrosuis]|uniref:CZB domain-containing protein n=1 Tax=Campylobacter gastrosuis TaxID=2974576 RepID=A0ABT7HPG0_9BACT|nr:CZB domain-containing protein [Campylobacter gastrosuis]